MCAANLVWNGFALVVLSRHLRPSLHLAQAAGECLRRSPGAVPAALAPWDKGGPLQKGDFGQAMCWEGSLSSRESQMCVNAELNLSSALLHSQRQDAELLGKIPAKWYKAINYIPAVSRNWNLLPHIKPDCLKGCWWH